MNSNKCFETLYNLREKYPPKQVTTGTGIFTFYTAGEGEKTVVLLPGGMGDGETYFFSLFELSKVFTVITVTYPPLSSFYSYVSGILELLQRENIKSFYVWGHSFGGIVAQQLVREVPDTITKVILSHTTAMHNRIPKAVKKEDCWRDLIPRSSLQVLTLS